MKKESPTEKSLRLLHKYLEISESKSVILGSYPSDYKDLFILLAKNRLICVTHHKQQHDRKFHSYFWVFLKSKCKVLY